MPIWAKSLLFSPSMSLASASGVRFLPTWIESREEILRYMSRLPLVDEALYVLYECWGGTFEHIEGFRFHGGKVVQGSEFNSENEKPDILYKKEFRNYGIAIGDDGYFEPFGRGYWGSSEYDHYG